VIVIALVMINVQITYVFNALETKIALVCSARSTIYVLSVQVMEIV
jgi:hypothetical protein